MLNRALVVWFMLLVVAFINGGVREIWLIPRTGDTAGHAISTITLCAGILVLSWITIGWMRLLSTRDAWMIGGVWAMLTLAFEFLAGHYLFGNPWGRLWADYNVLQGRVWVLVLLTTFVAPALAAHARSLVRTVG